MKTKISRMVGQLTNPFLFLSILVVISIGAVQVSPSTWFRHFSNTCGRVVAVIPANRTGGTGTYAIAVSHERNIIAAIPVVVSDFDLSVIPGSRKVIVDVEAATSKNRVPANVDRAVKVVPAKGSFSIEANATAGKTGVYEARIGIPRAENGTFSLYPVITTERKVLGVEGGGNIEVTPPSAGEKMPFVSVAAIILIILLGTALFMMKRL